MILRTTLWFIVVFIGLSLVGEVNGQRKSAGVKREAIRHMDAGRFGEAINLLTKYIAENPDSADGYYLRGLCYDNRSQLENAVMDFRVALKIDRTNQNVQRHLARVEQLWRSSLERKIEGHKRELARNPSSAENYLEIAKCLLSLERWNDAELWYDEYLRRAEPSPEQVIQYSELMAKNNQLAKGEKVLQRYTERYLDNQNLWTRYGYFLLWLGKYQQALRAFDRALSIELDLAEAREGSSQARSKLGFRSGEAKTDGQKALAEPEQTIDRNLRILRVNPTDHETRFLLVDELTRGHRFGEAYQHLDVLLKSTADSVRVKHRRFRVTALRDSVYTVQIERYREMLANDPGNKEAALQVARYYGELGDYTNALMFLDLYLVDVPEREALDVRFRYAQYAAWDKQYEKALMQLEILLREDPDNLEYQFLRAQISIWSVRDLDLAQRLLNNVYKHNPSNVHVLLALSSLNALQRNLPTALEFLELAKRIDPSSRDVEETQRFYDLSVAADAERATFVILTEARQRAAERDCEEAVKKYEEYFSRVPQPSTAILLEYADAHSCAKNLEEAIEIYDRILEKRYDYTVALLRAKNYLWSGNSSAALSEFNRIVAERPDDFTSKLYLGEAYQKMKKYSEARSIYQQLLGGAVDSTQREMVTLRLGYLPATGLSDALAKFPTHVAVAPPFTHYSDNEGFRLSHYGGRVEVGVLSALSVGASFLRSHAQSSLGGRTLTRFKGQLFLRVSDRLTVAGGFGTLTRLGGTRMTVRDAAVKYEKKNVVSLTTSFENTDAVLLLYSPYLVGLNYTGDFYRFSGWYQNRSQMRLSGYFKYFSISDGNSGSEVQLRFGRSFFEEACFGYEYVYTNYRHQAPFIPFTGRRKQLYYSPQNLESHSAWLEWNVQRAEDLAVVIGGRLGYIPSFHATVREISGQLKYQSLHFIIEGSVTLGSTKRLDASYNYASASLSAYWSFF